MTEVAVKQPQSRIIRQTDEANPPWLISRTFVKKGAPVSEEVASSVNDGSLVSNGVAQQNLDVIVLRRCDYSTSRLAQIYPDGEPLDPPERAWREPMPFQTPDDHCAVYLSAGIDYDEIQRIIAVPLNHQKKDQDLQELNRRTNGAKDSNLPKGMRFIDCHHDSAQAIAVSTSNLEFVALSYVWGMPEADADIHMTSNTSLIPRTIRDAMTVVKELGLRYLWVDKYCIEERNRHTIISQMDKIYKAATLTIAAASGHNPFHGLPGVSRLRHHEFRTTDWYPHTAIIIKDPAVEIKNSHWSTRGWTYQEGLFSPRCLIFTPTQWILTQMGVSYREQRPFVHDWTPFPEFVEGPVSCIFEAINDYATRDLTYPSDSLEAFLGVLNDWQSQWWSHLSVFPFGGGDVLGWFPPSNIFLFLHGLFWCCEGASLIRVPTIPSWSWAGWRGFARRGVPFGKFNITDWAGMSTDIDVQICTDKPFEIQDYPQYISSVRENNNKGIVVDTLQITGWSIIVDIDMLLKLGVYWDSLNFLSQNRNGSLAILVICWHTWPQSIRRWKLLVVGKLPGTHDIYHRLGALLWKMPGWSSPETATFEGQPFERRSFTLV